MPFKWSLPSLLSLNRICVRFSKTPISYSNAVSVFNVPHLLCSVNDHINPGPSSGQQSDDFEHTSVPHNNLRRTQNGDHLRIVYTAAYLRFLRKHSQKVDNQVELFLLSLDIYCRCRARGRRAGQKAYRRASTCRALVAIWMQGYYDFFRFLHTNFRKSENRRKFITRLFMG
jgi:hypothetical protein